MNMSSQKHFAHFYNVLKNSDNARTSKIYKHNSLDNSTKQLFSIFSLVPLIFFRSLFSLECIISLSETINRQFNYHLQAPGFKSLGKANMLVWSPIPTKWHCLRTRPSTSSFSRSSDNFRQNLTEFAFDFQEPFGHFQDRLAIFSD